MKKFLMGLIVTVSLFIGGCATLDSILIPEEGMEKPKAVVVAEGVTGVLAATGNPYAVPALAGSTIISIIAGAYTTMRKKQEVQAEMRRTKGAWDKVREYKTVAEAVVGAVEEAKNVRIDDKGKTIGDYVKTKVEKNLRNKDAYLIGKAIIEAMKESE